MASADGGGSAGQLTGLAVALDCGLRLWRSRCRVLKLVEGSIEDGKPSHRIAINTNLNNIVGGGGAPPFLRGY
ncbi:uncharacterized protein PG986_002902 [Apiospora aurea]|uniref:Uncharacterized protein n=1 Tax=Apiospora aurea TaxID=335848 RepID=A0ABR1QQ50_9PEZI